MTHPSFDADGPSEQYHPRTHDRNLHSRGGNTLSYVGVISDQIVAHAVVSLDNPTNLPGGWFDGLWVTESGNLSITDASGTFTWINVPEGLFKIRGTTVNTAGTNVLPTTLRAVLLA